MINLKRTLSGEHGCAWQMQAHQAGGVNYAREEVSLIVLSLKAKEVSGCDVPFG